MSEPEPSPWPESRRSQSLLFGVGGLFLLASLLGLAGVVEMGGAVVVGFSAIASALLIYGLLGWAPTWIEDGERDDADEARGDADEATTESDETDANPTDDEAAEDAAADGPAT